MRRKDSVGRRDSFEPPNQAGKKRVPARSLQELDDNFVSVIDAEWFTRIK